MPKEKNNHIKDATNFEELLNAKYGERGTPNRNQFEESAQRFYISEMLKQASGLNRKVAITISPA